MLMMTYQGFLNRLQKRGSKPHTISHCLGVRDAWKWVRRNRWKRLEGNTCSQALYSCIINMVNQLLMEQLIEGHRIDIPQGMGSLYLASIPARIALDGGELKTNYRTDWPRTLKLWYEDDEARESHRTVKRIQKDIVFIRYDKRTAKYTNRRFYLFRANRSLVRKVGRALEERKINVMELKT